MEKQHIQYAIDYALENSFFVGVDKQRAYFVNIVVFQTEDELKKSNLKNLNIQEIKEEKSYYTFGFKSDFDKDFLTKVFIRAYKKSSDEEKENLLKKINIFLGNSWSERVLPIIENIAQNHKEATDIINKIPISIWNAKSVNYEKIDELLVKKEATDDDMLKFYVNFFKKRKNHLKSNKLGFEFKNFIFNKFQSKEKIKKFIDISNYIKEEFVQNEFSINEISGIDTVVLKINCKKLLEQMCNPKYYLSTLEQDLYILTHGIKKYKNIEFVEMENQDKKNYLLELRFFHKNSINQKEIEDIFREFLLFKKKEQNFEANQESIAAWLFKQDLDKDLHQNKLIEKNNKIGFKL